MYTKVNKMETKKYNIITEWNVTLSDGTTICCDHNAGCCENNFASFEALKDTTFEDVCITYDNLEIEANEYGFKINGYFVPCYSMQNGWYSTDIDIYVNDDLVTTTECNLIEW